MVGGVRRIAFAALSLQSGATSTVGGGRRLLATRTWYGSHSALAILNLNQSESQNAFMHAFTCRSGNGSSGYRCQPHHMRVRWQLGERGGDCLIAGRVLRRAFLQLSEPAAACAHADPYRMSIYPVGVHDG